ncbi:MAG: hypothetical protein LBL92_03520 [Propionibacteriaceae bacterium]|jgi:nitroreductase|nr:hypothetical protein [Propionibacteriaceae bacterium]
MDRQQALAAIQARHAVRQFTDQPLEPGVRQALMEAVAAENEAGGLHLQVLFDEPAAFGGMRAHYGRFRGVRHYLALIGRKAPDLAQRCGFHGQQVVLLAQHLGLNSCWVALNFSRSQSRAEVGPKERFVVAVALGYGVTPGRSHKVRALTELGEVADGGPWPPWFEAGVAAAQLAPSGLNQQRFHFRLEGEAVTGSAGWSSYAEVDLGIARRHFQIGAGPGPWHWA